MRSATISVILFKSKVLSNGDHPIMLRICKKGIRKYVSIGLSCKLELWDHIKSKPKKKHPESLLFESIIDQKIQQYRNAELEAKNDGKTKSSAELISTIERTSSSISLLEYFDKVINDLRSSHQVGNANVYLNTKNSIKNFSGNTVYSFQEFDYSVLAKYETWMRKRNVSESTLSIHFRTLRSLFNMAINENVINAKHYPFKTFKVTKFDTQPNRRAITKADIKNIEALNIEQHSELFRARQIFLFTYYSQGINFIDLAKLKWENLRDGRIFYQRSKTGKKMNFIVYMPIREILNYYSTFTNKNSDCYIFPILDKEKHNTPVQILNRVHKKLTQTNALLKQLGKLAKIDTPLTTYVARHTFATTMKREGVSTSIISEAMGHSTEHMTQNYLKSFENHIIDNAVINSL